MIAAIMIRYPIALTIICLVACGAPPRVTMPLRDSARERGGVLITYRDGIEIGRTRWHDDGEVLESALTIAGEENSRMRIERSTHRIRYERGDDTLERVLEDGVVVLENLDWAAYAIVAEQYAAACEATSVRYFIPSHDRMIDATIRVSSDAGQTRLELRVETFMVRVWLDETRQVVRATVPLQRIEVRREDEPAPLALLDRPAPEGIESERVHVIRGGVDLEGDLWVPRGGDTAPLPIALIIAGSGPTDRDGNNPLGVATDTYRMIAEGLARRGIASVRYDKRAIGRSGRNFVIEDTVFDDFVDDAAAFAQWIRNDSRFGPLTVVGHSEGGEIATLLAHRLPIEALVLLATSGRSLAVLLREQLARRFDESILREYDRVVDALRNHEPLGEMPEPIAHHFRPAIHAFLRSALDRDPIGELRAIRIPTLVVQGETDIQVTTEDAHLLATAGPHVRMRILPATNHVLKSEPEARPGQLSYADPTIPLAPGVLDAIESGIAR